MLSLAFHMALSLVCTNKMHNKDVQHEACFREQLIARLCFASGVATVAKAATALCAMQKVLGACLMFHRYSAPDRVRR